MRTTLPCSTCHLPLQTARAHGSHFQMGSLSPRKPFIKALDRASRYHGGRRWTAVTSSCAPRPIVPTRCGRRRATSSPTRPFPTQHHGCFPAPTTLLDQHHAAVSPRAEEDLGGMVPHQRYGRRAGHLVPYTASLATHAASDAGQGRSRVSMGCSLRQGSSASSQVRGALVTSTIIYIIQPETPARQ